MSPPTSSRDSSDFHFSGFLHPTTTPVPDAVFDELMPRLTEAELKVLLYIVRRTFGFRKESDAISLNQLVNGIETRDGRILDSGTGMSRSSVIRGTSGLVEKGVITVEKRHTEDGENEINVYSLRFRDEQGVVSSRDYPSSKLRQPVVAPQNPQETALQQTEQQETDLSKGTKPRQGNWKQAPGWCQRFMEDFSHEFGDADAIGSNTTRLWRMWEDSGIPDVHFSPLVYKARTVTWQQPFAGYETDEPGPSGLRKVDRMPYFFEVLKDLIAQTRGESEPGPKPLHPMTEERIEELRRYGND
jgi:Bacteriophage replication protein O